MKLFSFFFGAILAQDTSTTSTTSTPEVTTTTVIPQRTCYSCYYKIHPNGTEGDQSCLEGKVQKSILFLVKKVVNEPIKRGRKAVQQHQRRVLLRFQAHHEKRGNRQSRNSTRKEGKENRAFY